jgi:integrase
VELIKKKKTENPGWTYLFGKDEPHLNVKKEFNILGKKLPWLKEKKITAHTFRHTVATELKRIGAPDDLIQRQLTHKDIRSTQLYIHAIYSSDDKKYLEKAMGELLPKEG